MKCSAWKRAGLTRDGKRTATMNGPVAQRESSALDPVVVSPLERHSRIGKSRKSASVPMTHSVVRSLAKWPEWQRQANPKWLSRMHSLGMLAKTTWPSLLKTSCVRVSNRHCTDSLKVCWTSTPRHDALNVARSHDSTSVGFANREIKWKRQTERHLHNFKPQS